MVKTSTLAIILAALIISVVFTGEADGAGLVWRAINKSGSSIHDLGNVTSRGCAVNQYLSVNSTGYFACTTLTAGSNALLDGSVHTDTVAQTPTRGSIIYSDSTPKWNELVLGLSGQFLFSDGADVKYGTIKNKLLDGSNHTDTSSATVVRGDIIYGDSTPTWNRLAKGLSGQFLFSDGTDVKYGTINNKLLDGSNHTDTVSSTVTRGDLIYGTQSNLWGDLAAGAGGSFLYTNGTDPSWKVFQVWTQSASSGTFITGINNSTGVISTQDAFINITPISTTAASGNATLIAANATDSGVFKNISAINGTSITNGTNELIIQNTRVVSLTANVTSSEGGLESAAGGGYTDVFVIPLTINSGNSISGQVIATTTSTTNGIQLTANVTTAQSSGICSFNEYTGVAAQSLDIFALNSSNPSIDTASLAPFPIATGFGIHFPFDCNVVSGSTPTNLRILFQSENAGTTVEVKAGSYYIKTP